MALDGTPKNVDVQKIRSLILRHPEIADVHHIHIWSISSRQNAMTAHLVLKNDDLDGFVRLKQSIRHDLGHAGIHHVPWKRS
jgi:cobalt-zinc-cadmium efflux system protein